MFGRLTNQAKDVVDVFVFDANENRRIASLQEAASGVDPSGAILVVD
jgi:hypothetical protein